MRAFKIRGSKVRVTSHKLVVGQELTGLSFAPGLAAHIRQQGEVWTRVHYTHFLM